MKIVCILSLLEPKNSQLYKDSCSILQTIAIWNENKNYIFDVVVVRTHFNCDDCDKKNILKLVEDNVDAFFVFGDPAMVFLAERLEEKQSSIPVFVLACRHCLKYRNIFYLWRDAATIANRISEELRTFRELSGETHANIKIPNILILHDDGEYGNDYKYYFDRYKETFNIPFKSYSFSATDNEAEIRNKLENIEDLYNYVVIVGYGDGFENCFKYITKKLTKTKYFFTDHFNKKGYIDDQRSYFYPIIDCDVDIPREFGHYEKRYDNINLYNIKQKSQLLNIKEIDTDASNNNSCEKEALGCLACASLDVLMEAQRRNNGNSLSDTLFSLKYINTSVGPFIVQDCEGSCFNIRMQCTSEKKLRFPVSLERILSILKKLGSNVKATSIPSHKNGLDENGVKEKNELIKRLNQKSPISLEKIAFLLQTVDDNIIKINKDIVRNCISQNKIKGDLEKILDYMFKPLFDLFKIKTAYMYDDFDGTLGCVYNYNFNYEEDARYKENIDRLLSSGFLNQLDAPLQINASIDDVEDNDAFRLYVAKGNEVFPFVFFAATNNGDYTINGIILARTERSALQLWKKRSNQNHSKSIPVITDKGENSFFFDEEIVRRDILKSGIELDKYFYFIPYSRGSSEKNQSDSYNGWLVVDLEDEQNSTGLDYLSLRYLNTIFSRIFAPLHSALTLSKLEIAYIKSAIGSIMSRNGSHNIGSHVLAALSHNVGTMPDDRVLYQYIQQRMDYIATATTERPLWRQPILFVSGIMRQFLIQRHLLNFISGSEGLHAYQFQNKSVSPDQKETIRIHVRRIEVPDGVSDKSWESDGFFNKESHISNFILYPEDGELKEDKLKELFRDKDLSVAIPGGIVGTHAFYTIIENILRNAAKHEWSKIDKDKQKNRNLDIYIDFRDNPDMGIVECRIWNDKASDPTGSENEDMKKLLNNVEEKIKTSFIEEDGKLRKENWGIAEMRISAGYLKLADIADIGAIGFKSDEDGSENNTLKIIRPVLIDNKAGRKCLGYRFDLFKPRELLVVVPNDIKIPQKAQKNAKQYGIWFLSDDDASKEKALPYSYVLFKTFSLCENAQGGYKLPFRVLAENRVDIDTGNKESLEKKLTERLIAKYSGSFYSKIIDHFKELSNSKTVAKACYNLLDEIYDSWVEHIFTQRNFSEVENRPSLVLDIERDSGNGKKSLVTESDLIHFIFEHSFNSAVRSFKEFYKGNATNNFWSVLERIINMSPRKICSRSELINEFGNGESSFSTKDEVKSQIMIWEDDLIKEFKFNTEEFESCTAFNDFIDYICGPILAQANAFLSKYEETFVTLPEYFSSDNDKGKQDDQKSTSSNLADNNTKFFEWKDWNKLNIIITSDDETRNNCLNNGSLCYFRHNEEKMDKIPKGYLEPLSGAQSNMNTIISFAGDVKKLINLKNQEDNFKLKIEVKRFATDLVENAISRLLIIDERVKKFMDNHNEVNNMLNGLGIAVIDHKDDIAIKLLSGDLTVLNDALESDCNGLKVKDFDIAIIHQGIIDKLLEKHEDKIEVRKLLKLLIANMRYVVITTGRGTPANIPDDARVIPYSVIENTLLKRFPEKLILVNSIMNVLPIGKES